MDYLLWRSLPIGLPDSVLFISSDAISIMKDAVRKAKSKAKQDLKSCTKMSEKYLPYAQREYKLIATVCNQGHYILVTCTFNGQVQDINDVFTNVKVYDSMYRVDKSNDNDPPHPESLGSRFLCLFQ